MLLLLLLLLPPFHPVVEPHTSEPDQTAAVEDARGTGWPEPAGLAAADRLNTELAGCWAGNGWVPMGSDVVVVDAVGGASDDRPNRSPSEEPGAKPLPVDLCWRCYQLAFLAHDCVERTRDNARRDSRGR